MRVTLLVLLLSSVGADIAPLTKLTNPAARCMDGTLSGFYHQRATEAASKAKWVIHLQGGGECVDSVQCARRFNTSLASSDYFPDYINLTYDPTHNKRHASESDSGGGGPDMNCKWDKFGWWLCDDNPDTNPELYGYHHVWLPYCSGDLWSGQKLTSTSLPMPDAVQAGLGSQRETANVSVYFSGHFILGAALEALDDLGLDDAELIVISGNSAGAIGMWLSIDYINERYTNAFVVGVSIAGFYSYSFPYGPGRQRPEQRAGRLP